MSAKPLPPIISLMPDYAREFLVWAAVAVTLNGAVRLVLLRAFKGVTFSGRRGYLRRIPPGGWMREDNAKVCYSVMTGIGPVAFAVLYALGA